MKKIMLNITKGLLIVPALMLGVLAFTPVATVGAQDLSIGDGADSAQGEDQEADLFGDSGVFRIITNVLLFLIGAISVIMLIIGGIRYTISGGDSAAVTSAKNTILYAIVGIVVAILAYAIVNFVIGSFVNN